MNSGGIATHIKEKTDGQDPRLTCIVTVITGLTCAGCLIGAEMDYLFSASGTVVQSDGDPLPGVTVFLKISQAVFDVITPVERASQLTEENGEFDFMYIAHAPSIPYTLTFEKEGYRTEFVEVTEPNDAPISVTMEKEEPDPSTT